MWAPWPPPLGHALLRAAQQDHPSLLLDLAGLRGSHDRFIGGDQRDTELFEIVFNFGALPALIGMLYGGYVLIAWTVSWLLGRTLPVWRPGKWAIVGYVRALQRSQNARVEDVPEDLRPTLR